jgi:hypothetical protein
VVCLGILTAQYLADAAAMWWVRHLAARQDVPVSPPTRPSRFTEPSAILSLLKAFPGLEPGHFGLPSVNLPLLVELLALEVELVGLELEQLGLLAECLHRVLGGEVRAHSRPAVARAPIHVAQMSDTDVPPAVCTTWITGLAWLALGLGRLGLGEAPNHASMVSGMAEA